MNYIIDRATVDDAEKILALTKICGAETDNLSYGDEGLPISVEQERCYLESVLQSDKDIFYVVRVGQNIVGIANYSTFSKRRMVHRGELGLCVRKSAWGKGIGHALMEKILAFAKNNAQVEIISLEVRNDNIRAIKLYQDFGFKKIGTFEGYFKIDGKLVDFDIMELKLR